SAAGDVKIGLHVAVALLDIDLLQLFRKSLARMLLKEALPGQPLGTAHERQRTFAGNRQQAFCRSMVEGGQFVLGGTGVRKNLSIAVGDGDAGDPSLIRAQELAVLGGDVSGGLVLSAAEVDTVAYVPIGGELREVYLDHQFRFQPERLRLDAPRRAGERGGLSCQPWKQIAELLHIVC